MIKQQLYSLIRVMAFFCALPVNSLLAAQGENDSLVVNSDSNISTTISKGELHIVGDVVMSGTENIKNAVITKSKSQDLDQKISNTTHHTSAPKQLDAPKPTVEVKVNKLGMERLKIRSGSSDSSWQDSTSSISKSTVLSVVQFKFLAAFIFCFILCFNFLLSRGVKIIGRYSNIISMFLKVGYGRPPPFYGLKTQN